MLADRDYWDWIQALLISEDEAHAEFSVKGEAALMNKTILEIVRETSRMRRRAMINPQMGIAF
jgi:hypothetical protein